MLCTERSLVKNEPGLLTVLPLRCRRWTCEHCMPFRGRQLRSEALQGAPTIFLTLTIRKGRFASPAQQAVELAKGWRMLRQYLIRTLNLDALPFMAVIEQHKSGWPHLHLLLRSKYLDHKLIRAWWTARFASPHIDIRAVRDQQQAAFYVTDYLKKAPILYEGCKRYWRSRDYLLPKKEADRPPADPDTYWMAMNVRPDLLAQFAYIDGARLSVIDGRWSIEGWSPDLWKQWGLG